jgi:hypothetical protein
MKIEIFADPSRPATISLSQRVAPASATTLLPATNGTGAIQRFVRPGRQLGRIIWAELRLERSWFAVFLRSPRMDVPAVAGIDGATRRHNTALDTERVVARRPRGPGCQDGGWWIGSAPLTIRDD